MTSARDDEPARVRHGPGEPGPDLGPEPRRVFAALAVRNFRLCLAGQAVSLPGTWMQVVAQSWLVQELTGSGAVLGLVAAPFLPVLLLGPYGGLIADRVDKRRLLLCTQAALGLLALVLGLLTVTGVVRLWIVFVLAVALGTVNSVDQPARQAFVPEMVGRDRVQNTVSLNSVFTNAARADPQFRGRVMALWSVTFTGGTPIGGPAVGVVAADDLGPRYGSGSAPPPASQPPSSALWP